MGDAYSTTSTPTLGPSSRETARTLSPVPGHCHLHLHPSAFAPHSASLRHLVNGTWAHPPASTMLPDLPTHDIRGAQPQGSMAPRDRKSLLATSTTREPPRPQLLRGSHTSPLFT